MPKGIFKKNLSDLTKDESFGSILDNETGNVLNVAHNDEEQLTPELNCFGYVFLKEKNGNYYTVRITFDEALTTTEFSDKEYAGTDKQMAIERLKIKLGEKVF